MKKWILGLMMLAALAVAGDASADLLQISNQGFEDLVLSPGQYVYEIPGWEIDGFGSTWYPLSSSFPDGAPEGHNTAAMGPTSFTSISQTLADVLTASTHYELTVDVGHRLDLGLALYNVQLLAGDTVLSEGTNPDIDAGQFIVLTVTYDALADDPQLGEPLRINLLCGEGGQVNFDDVRLDASAIDTPTPFGR